MDSGEIGDAPGVCAIAVTESRIECAAAVVTPAETRRRTKSRREIPLDNSCATRFLIAVLLRGRVSLRPPYLGEVTSHRADVILGPERAAPDHPVDCAFPRFTILPQRRPHAHLMALHASPREHIAARQIRQRRCLLADSRGWSRWRRARSEILAKIGGDDRGVRVRD